MDQSARARETGCGQAIVIVALLAWLSAVPVGAMFGLSEMLDGVAAPGLISAAVIVATGVLLLLLFVGTMLFARRRAGWETVAAVSVGLLIVTGYLLLDAAVQAVFSEGVTLALYGEDGWAAVLWLVVLVPYTLFVAWIAPRLIEISHLPPAPSLRISAWLGLDRFDLTTLLIALAVAALVTVSWPITGALGDSLTSLSLIFQTLAKVIPQVLIFWGVVFRLLTITFVHRRRAALTLNLLYGAFIVANVIPSGDWGALLNGIFLLPLASLFTKLRFRGNGGSVYPLLPVLFCYRAVPLLFVDPRDVLAQGGMMELQHVLSNVITIVTVGIIDIILFGMRQLLQALRGRLSVPVWASLTAAALAALLAWCVWGGLYVFAGNPGFTNDGFLIILEEQADLSTAHTIPSREARLEYVYETLVETAERTQAPLRAELDALGVPYRPYYITNMIRVDGRRWLVRRFEKQSGVARVILNPNTREYAYPIPIPDVLVNEPISGIQANLTGIHADDAWALGVTGDGIIVGGQDTGYDWTHPVLKPHYRGWDGQNASHDYNWHDAWNDTPVPFDDGAHGTHTMGTVLGDDGGRNRTGVAPGARWIGCRNMRRGYGNPASYTECMEFFIAPYPVGGDPFTDGDVRMAPHVINNSWGCPYWEGCSTDTFETAVEALRAAGIMMVVSAGNDGPGCETASTPPTNYDAVFAVGATSNGGDIVNFSSRGPVEGLVKPDVTAPGESVRSSVPGNGYAYYPGTSMAGPHVVGLVALLWSAEPSLIGDIDATESLICQTANPRPVDSVCTVEDQVPEGMLGSLFSDSVCACGDVTGVPNNVYGCGFIDAGAAVQAALGQ
ncbi:MAG: S8 family serine peptidase [Chloroflexi bacterium]|nr:S8 family serine peptidase [Chloroflexota bacterium]